jgi:hypothetical protein
VEYLKTVPRKSLPNKVLNSLSGARKTLSRISQHYEIIKNYIENKGDNLESSNNKSESQEINKAEAVLIELLESVDDKVRLEAAKLILNKTKYTTQ